jgi:transposase
VAAARAQADADAAGELNWLVAVDSTAVRVHQHGATARRTGGNAATVPADREVVETARQRAGGATE